MVWSIIYLIIIAVITLGGGYLVASRVLGQTAAGRNTRYLLPWMLFGAVLGWLSTFSNAINFQLILSVLFALGILGWLISWPRRKQTAGSLLVDIGRNQQAKLLWWIGLFELAMVVILTVSMVSGPGNNSVTALLVLWPLALMLLTVGRSHLEFRENGICVFLNVLPWRRITDYRWEADKANALTLVYHPRLPFSPSFMTLRVPAESSAQVNQLIKDQLDPEEKVREPVMSR